MRNGRALLAAMGWASSLVSSLAAERRPAHPRNRRRRSACPLASRTMKQASVSSTDQRGGKRRDVTAVDIRPEGGAGSAASPPGLSRIALDRRLIVFDDARLLVLDDEHARSRVEQRLIAETERLLAWTDLIEGIANQAAVTLKSGAHLDRVAVAVKKPLLGHVITPPFVFLLMPSPGALDRDSAHSPRGRTGAAMASSGTQCKPQSSRGLPCRLSALADSPSPSKAPRRAREGRSLERSPTASPSSATRLSLSFLRFCHGNAGENGVASRSWAKCLLENHHLHG